MVWWIGAAPRKVGRRDGWTLRPPYGREDIIDAGILRPNETAMKRFRAGEVGILKSEKELM